VTVIRRPQLKAARRHAEELGKQVGGMLRYGHEGENGEAIQPVLRAWREFLNQFGSDDDPVIRDYIADSFRLGVSEVDYRRGLSLVGTN
jgi:hypothetical protein